MNVLNSTLQQHITEFQNEIHEIVSKFNSTCEYYIMFKSYKTFINSLIKTNSNIQLTQVQFACRDKKIVNMFALQTKIFNVYRTLLDSPQFKKQISILEFFIHADDLHGIVVFLIQNRASINMHSAIKMLKRNNIDVTALTFLTLDYITESKLNIADMEFYMFTIVFLKLSSWKLFFNLLNEI